jgi:arylsulfatase A-like enzyme
MVYFNGFVHKDDWNYERWAGYETDGLFNYAKEFMHCCKDEPFLMFLSPHQPHYTPFEFAPQKFYDALPTSLLLPSNVPQEQFENSMEMMRHYLAMILAIDEMLGNVLDDLERRGLVDNTIVVLASDHGTQGGSQGVNPWSKKNPYDASIHVPGVVRFPGVIQAGVRNDSICAMVDWFPSLCGLAGVTVPRSVEGTDLSPCWRGLDSSSNQDDAFIMNFSKYFDWFKNGAEWRGVRTTTHTYAIWLGGREEFYDLVADPMQLNDLSAQPEALALLEDMRSRLAAHQQRRRDHLQPCEDAKDWLDDQRRVVKNAFGDLSHPECLPDWSLLSN